MPREERRARLAPLRTRVAHLRRAPVGGHRSSSSWRKSTPGGRPVRPHRRRRAPRAAPSTQRLADDRLALLLLLDYDGTLVPFTPTPELARPDREVLELLRALAARPDTQVHVVSGRPQNTLQEWLGDLPIWLHAEHGFLSRDPATRQWVPAAELGGSWREPVLAMLREITQRTPGLAGRGQGGGAGVALPDGGPGDRGAPRQRAAPPPEPGPQQPARGDPRRATE